MSSASHYILTWQCPDNSGVLAKVSQSLFSHGAFITETSQYSDPYSETFFSRIAFDDRNLTVSSREFVAALDELAKPLAMQYQLRKRDDVPNILIAVSKDDHCLVSLLTKWKSGVLPINIVGVISNHQNCQALSEWHNIPFFYLPVTAETKRQQEAQITALMTELKVDLLVLARYMQILSDDFCQQLSGRAINIHHSFLPSFKGARPYHQAHARGVKVIGATAHYVTAHLDEGPIIAQEVKPINHTFTIEQMVHMGHDLEATALSHAVRLHAEQRVCLNGDKTVILA
ncbi:MULTISPECIES: formyltetrahydrofolate deformylase [Colwellia]|uniref:Formyltetrahydrofolate deformylase n=1 Tax=Colwellia marinimaniae TaxID=1513592 RepID=A0ABQ0MQG8_9GAMM|nr:MULTISPECIES: formyltetrahydrofolate deformylase [Colwellia]GAW94617.1 formyltetrahydrofolate deformylase [Colwellia marinimaniae]